MAYSAPSTRSTGELCTAAIWNADVVANEIAIYASIPHINEGRLTLTSGTPVTTADVTGAGTVYFALDKGDKISLYDGSSAWVTVTFAEMSIALSGGTASKPADIFLDYNGGSPALTLLAWTNDTTRATALVAQNGVLCKTGDLQQRYLGTLRLDGSKQCEDSDAKRLCWNYYNQRPRPMRALETTDAWTYTTATWRQVNAATGNQLEFVIGVDEQSVRATATQASANSESNIWRNIGIGLDSTSAIAAGSTTGRAQGAGGEIHSAAAHYVDFPGIGRHTLVWLEISRASGTTTWTGDAGDSPPSTQTGIVGMIRG